MLLLCWKGLRNVGHDTIVEPPDIERLALLARGRGISTIVVVLLFGTLQKIPLIQLFMRLFVYCTERAALWQNISMNEHVLHHVFGIFEVLRREGG